MKGDIKAKDFVPTKAHLKRLAKFVEMSGIEKTKTGKLVLYKAVSLLGFNVAWGRTIVKYVPGRYVSVEDVNVDPVKPCAAGLHAGTKDCARFYQQASHVKAKIIKVLVDPTDVICVPHAAINGLYWSNGAHKIRVRRLYVSKEKVK